MKRDTAHYKNHHGGVEVEIHLEGEGSTLLLMHLAQTLVKWEGERE